MKSMRSKMASAAVLGILSASLLTAAWSAPAAAKKAAPKSGKTKYDPVKVALADIAKMKVGSHDWPQWGGWTGRNNTPDGKNIPIDWDTETGKNIKWKVKLGSQCYGNPVVANGKIYCGTNNYGGYLKRYPPTVDLGCLLCFDEKTGKFLWQHSSEKLPSGRVNDWPKQGICSAVYADDNRVWCVTSRGEVVCLDAEGFRDGKNNGPFTAEPNQNSDEADVIWKFDMMGTLGSFQHNMCACSVTSDGKRLFVNTGNGMDATHLNLPAPNAPSFFALDRDSGKLLWTDKSPGEYILHGQWSSPTYAVLGGQPQVLFAGGDGWLYSFDPKGDGNGNSKLLWKFDANPKTSKWILGGTGTRNNIIATPVVYDGLVYVAVGQDPEHGENMGHLWCVDPTKRGDVSPTLAVDAKGKPVPRQRLQAVITADGEKEIPNPNSAAVWEFGHMTQKAYDAAPFEKQMHRSCGTVAIKNDLLYIADFSGLFHCLNAKTGKQYWVYDMFAAAWGSPLIVDGHVYIGDEDGDIAIFNLSGDPKVAMKPKKDAPEEFEPIKTINMGNSVYTTPIVANNVLFIANKSNLYAISPGGK